MTPVYLFVPLNLKRDNSIPGLFPAAHFLKLKRDNSIPGLFSSGPVHKPSDQSESFDGYFFHLLASKFRIAGSQSEFDDGGGLIFWQANSSLQEPIGFEQVIPINFRGHEYKFRISEDSEPPLFNFSVFLSRTPVRLT